MGNKNIDWEGNCEFDENGKVSGFKKQSSSNSYSMVPIPNGEKLLEDARDAEKVLASIMQTASGAEIAVAIKKLSLHCGMQAKAPDDVKHMFVDYCQALAEYPKVLIDEACAHYRKLPEGNNFLPSSGKLISLMSSKYHNMKGMQKREDQILGKYQAKQERENKSVSIMDAINNLNL